MADPMTVDLDALNAGELIDLNIELGALRSAVLERQRAVNARLDRFARDASARHQADLADLGALPPAQTVFSPAETVEAPTTKTKKAKG